MAAIHRELGDEIETAMLEVVRSGQFVGGPRVESFEQAFADYLGAAEAIGLANGTDALELALRALGIKAGAEVLVPANTFIATAEAVVRAGATPRFVDVDAETGLLDLDSAAERVTDRTEAIIPVHLYGRMLDMDPVMAFAERYELAVIEDAAQAHGAHRGGRRAGTIAHVGCFSFYPGKNLGAFGDAGAAVTGDPILAARLRLLRDHGRRGYTDHELVGFNSRLDPLQAVVLEHKLAHLDRWNDQRRQAVAWYREVLDGDVLDGVLDRPEADVHHIFPILTDDRDGLAERLTEAGVQTGIHYPQALSLTPAFAHAERYACPAAEARAERQLSLPMHPHLDRDAVEYIAGVISYAAADAGR
jgi:dTDP-4-amino-4,6-dideoxygalactose transaminase